MNVDFEHMVRQRAYELWLGSGMVSGRDADHWHAAEAELASLRARAPKEAVKPAKTKPGRARAGKSKR